MLSVNAGWKVGHGLATGSDMAMTGVERELAVTTAGREGACGACRTHARPSGASTIAIPAPISQRGAPTGDDCNLAHPSLLTI